MRTKKIMIISISVTGLLLLVGGGGFAYHVSRQQIDTISELNRACHHARDKDGYGNVTLSGGNFSNQRGAITVPCKIHLASGSTLQISHVQLETKDLVIFDIPQDHKPAIAKQANHVTLNHAKLHSQTGNFQINLGNPGSTATINNSAIDYPLSVVIGAGEGDSDHTASLTALSNTMRSIGPEGKGIILVTTGTGVFKDNQFEVNDSIGSALLLGQTCEFHNNINANDRCQGGQEVVQ